MDEIWVPVFSNTNFLVSNYGRVKTIDRRVSCHKTHYRTVKGRVLAGTVATTGYHQIMINKKSVLVHRLVAEAFLDRIEGKNQVNHKDGNKLNNHVENLEWCTPGENIFHMFNTLGVKKSASGKFGKDHPTSKAIVCTSLKTGEEKYFECGLMASRELGLDSGSISRCCSGEYKSTKGYMVRFA